MTRALQLFTSMAFVFALSSCTVSRHPAGIAASTAPVAPGYTKIGPVEGSSCSYWLFFIPLGGMDGPEEIIDQLVKEKGAVALVGVTVEHRRSAFALPLFGSECTVVEGQAVRGASK